MTFGTCRENTKIYNVSIKGKLMALRACDSCECFQGGDARACSSSESAIGTPVSRATTSIFDYEECYLSWIF